MVFPEADIAVLRLLDKPPSLSFEPLAVRYFRPLIPEREQESALERCKVAIFGYPCMNKGQEEGYVVGFVDAAKPFGWSDEKTDDGSKVAFEVRRLNVTGNTRGSHLPGISGAPMFAFPWDCVIGVEGSCSARRTAGPRLGHL